jgi:hypothetical protein
MFPMKGMGLGPGGRGFWDDFERVLKYQIAATRSKATPEYPFIMILNQFLGLEIDECLF